MLPCRFYELSDDLIQACVATAGENGELRQFVFVILDIEKGQAGIGASDVSGQDHFSKFLQWRPSRSSSSSESFGPQVPEA